MPSVGAPAVTQHSSRQDLNLETGSVVSSGSISSDNDKVTREMVDRALARLLMYGATTTASVKPILSALQAADPKKEDPVLVRALYYLVQLTLGDGSAGTPLPVPNSKGVL